MFAPITRNVHLFLDKGVIKSRWQFQMLHHYVLLTVHNLLLSKLHQQLLMLVYYNDWYHVNNYF